MNHFRDESVFPLGAGLSAARRARGILDRRASALLHRHLAHLRGGLLTIHDADGTVRLGEEASALAATVRLHRTGVYRRVVLGGTFAAARAYVRGDWSADDLTAVCRIFARNPALADGLDRGWARPARSWRRALGRPRRNSRRGSRRNIHRHYDLGNAFFQLFLDETMSYSCGIFERPDATMHEASVAKMERVCRELRLDYDDHLLEIGSGWGGLAIHAASRYGCRVTTTTISTEQHALASARVRRAGLSDRVTVLLADYRDLDGTYDKLASIEMIEAVGHEYLDTCFAQCGRRLKPGGLMLLQAITVPDDRYEAHLRSADFMQHDVFPGSNIPSLGAIRASMARASSLRIAGQLDLTPHYGETLRRWRRQFADRLDDVRALGLSEDFIRMWEFYLSYTEAGFEERMIGNVQLTIEQGQAA